MNKFIGPKFKQIQKGKARGENKKWRCMTCELPITVKLNRAVI